MVKSVKIKAFTRVRWSSAEIVNAYRGEILTNCNRLILTALNLKLTVPIHISKILADRAVWLPLSGTGWMHVLYIGNTCYEIARLIESHAFRLGWGGGTKNRD